MNFLRRDGTTSLRRGVLAALAALSLLLGASVWAGAVAAQTIFQDGFEGDERAPLNDTGITWSGHQTSGNATTCDAGTDPDHPAGQDCQFGRDAKAAVGQLTKIGASTSINGVINGFDYTKISNSGNGLPASAALGSGPNDWACTRDNVTGLIWEVKTTSGLRSQDHAYTWYNRSSPDGNPGYAGTTSTCASTLGSTTCNTENYIAAVNNTPTALCGHRDWRMPSRSELLSIVDSGRSSPSIDPGYFPNTLSSYFWSGSSYADHSNYAWLVVFHYGYANYYFRGSNGRARLVRGGQ